MPDIKEWLEGLGCGQYADAFEENRIGTDMLTELDHEILKDIGVSAAGDRIAILRAARETAASASAGTAPAEPKGAPAGSPKAESAREAERRQLTVMFCDLVGSTALSEKLDPEDLRTVMQAYQEAAKAILEQYEGHVAQYLGDGLMVYFGWPRAHEDDAERAVRAGLKIVEAVKGVQAPEPLQVRIGISTGLVVVGETGAGDASVPKLAVGETPNIAARTQGIAGPDQVVVADSTRRLAGGVFDYETLGEQSLKGVVDPVRCWRVSGLDKGKSDPDSLLPESLTQFIGRERELAGLEERLIEVEAGRGQVVVLTGDAGVGKSRLLREFRQRVSKRVAWAEGRSISFGQSMVFHPLMDLLRKNFRIDEDADTEDIRLKVTSGLTRIAADLSHMAHYIHYLLGAAEEDDPVGQMDPQLRRAETFDVLRQILLAAAERHPQVLLFEDLHWSDTATTEFLGYLADSLPGSRVLLLVTLRTGYSSPIGDRSYVTRLPLQNLGPEQATQIAAAVLAATEMPPELEALVQRKAEGNPFFVEEMVKSLSENGAIRREGNRWVLSRGLDQIDVPDTIQGVLLSRIDRLEQEARTTLQLASVIGREFTQRLLHRISDLRDSMSESLRELQALELIHQKSLKPELAFMFKHALAQDVAYESLLLQRRRSLHRRVAEAIEELYGERLDEHTAMIAYHYAAAEDWEKAGEYFDKAADLAAAAFAMHEAIELCGRAIDALERDGRAELQQKKAGLHEKKAGLHFLVSDFAGAHAENDKAAILAGRSGDRAREGAAIAGMAFASVLAHQFDRSLKESDRAIEIAQEVGSDRILASGHFSIGCVEHLRGHLVDARQNHERAYELSKLADDPHQRAMSATFLSELDNWEGNYALSVSRAREGVEVARKHNFAFPELFSLWGLSLPLIAKGDYDDGYVALQEAMALAQKLGDEFRYLRALNTLAWLHAECGGTDKAIEINEQAREPSAERGDPEIIANVELNLADAFLVRNDRKLAREQFEYIHKIAGDPTTSEWMRWRYSQHLFAGYGEVCLALDEPAKAEDWANQCLDLASRTDSKKYMARAWRLKGDIATSHLKWEEAEECLMKASGYADEIGNPTQQWRTYLALHQLYLDTNRRELADKSGDAARAVLDTVNANLKTPELRESFENSPLFREVAQRCNAT